MVDPSLEEESCPSEGGSEQGNLTVGYLNTVEQVTKIVYGLRSRSAVIKCPISAKNDVFPQGPGSKKLGFERRKKSFSGFRGFSDFFGFLLSTPFFLFFIL